MTLAVIIKISTQLLNTTICKCDTFLAINSKALQNAGNDLSCIILFVAAFKTPENVYSSLSLLLLKVTSKR